jgi:hypothetical protein
MQLTVRLADYLWRPLTDAEEDTAFVLRMRNSTAAQGAFFTPQISREDHLRFLRSSSRDEEFNWIIEQSGERLGASGLYHLDRKNRRIEAGRVVTLVPQLYSFNLLVSCFVAFEHLQLNKLVGDALASNAVVARALERVGVEREGVLREHIFKDGQFHDVLLFGILAPTWRGMRPPLFELYGQPRILPHDGLADC